MIVFDELDLLMEPEIGISQVAYLLFHEFLMFSPLSFSVFVIVEDRIHSV